jgi:hypothetical protein
MNYEIMGSVDKKTIVDMARRNPTAVREYLQERESCEATPYDFVADKKGVWSWYPAVSEASCCCDRGQGGRCGSSI